MKKKLKNFLKKNITPSGFFLSRYNHYPLLENAFTEDDIFAAVEVILSRRITMSDITKNFEYEFGKYIVGNKYALMTNSGSSANLLAAFTLINPKKNFS
jgi:CDP-6-deoxy-D-xylo-4-hexulose-3-dehydrase